MKKLKDPTTQIGSHYRQDTNADGFRNLYENYHAPIYDYAVNYLNDEVTALNLTNAYFENMAERFTNFEQREDMVDKLSTNSNKSKELESFFL